MVMVVATEPLEPPSKRRRMGPPQEGGNVVLAEPSHPPHDPLPPSKPSTHDQPNDEVMEVPHPPLNDPDPPLQQPGLTTRAGGGTPASSPRGGWRRATPRRSTRGPGHRCPIPSALAHHTATCSPWWICPGPLQLPNGERVLDRFVHIIYDDQTTAFKLNFAYGLILRHRETHQVRYYYPSLNNARVLPTPHLLQNRATLTALLEENTAYKTHDAMTWGRLQRPDTKWFVEQVTNVLFYVNKLPELMIGAPATTTFPDYLLKNRGLYALTHGSHGPYTDNLCFFRCLAIHLDGAPPKDCDTQAQRYFQRYLKAVEMEAKHFRGVPLSRLDRAETLFDLNIAVYDLTLEVETRHAVCVRRSLGQHTSTMTLNLYQRHFSYVKDRGLYAHQYQCQQCGRNFQRSTNLHRHEKTCDVSIKKRYPGGVFHNTPTIFDDLMEEGIALPHDALYFPYRACFDFEAYLEPLETDDSTTSKTVWIDRHIPMSVSVNANVPGYQHPRCFVSDGDPYALMATFIEYLNEISAASYQRMLLKFESVLAVLDARIPAQSPGQPKPKPPPYAAVLKTKLLKYLTQLPVLGFNTGRYDFNMVKRYMYPYLAHRQTLKYVIKKQQSHGDRHSDPSVFRHLQLPGA